MKAYTYNDRLVGVGNDQILGTDQGGGSTYTAGNGIDITNDVISVDDTVALVSALPTTELGKFTIQNNVSGGPIEVLIPTDVAPVSAFYDLNAQYDDALSNRTGPYRYYYVFKSPGYDNDTWSANTGDVIQLKVKESIQGIGSIMGFYASNSSPASSSAPTINYPSSTPLVAGSGATYTVEHGVYTTGLGANPAGSSYGKYITLMISTGGPTGTYIDDILNKIEFTIGGPNAALGTTVNLSRYYLGNTVSSSTLSSELACQVTVNGTTKQQTVYLPGAMPSSWTSRVARYVEYGSNRFNSDYYYTSQQYIAYKYTSSPCRYQYAYLTDWDYANSIMTFIAYDNSGNAIEKWTLNYANYSSNVWTTTPISSGSTYTAGQYISIDGNDVISVTGVAPASAIPDVSDMATKTWVSEQGYLTEIPSTYATDIEVYNATVTAVNAATALIPDVSDMATQTWVGNQGYLTSVPSNYATDIEVSQAIASSIVQSDWAVTAVDSPAYIDNKPETLEMELSPVTGGNCISITEGNAGSIDWITTAGITDIVSVTALPANPVATVIYLIPET